MATPTWRRILSWLGLVAPNGGVAVPVVVEVTAGAAVGSDSDVPPWQNLRPAHHVDGGRVRAAVLRDLLRRLDAVPAAAEATPQDRSDARFLSALVRTLGSETLELPVFPDVARKLDRLLRQPDVPPAAVEALVASDPDLLRRVWTAASSAVYARGVAGLDHAIARLGHDALWRIAMGACLHAPIFRVGRYQTRLDRIRMRGEVVGAVAAWLDDDPRGDAFLGGMMSGAGALMVLRCASQAGRQPPSASLVQDILDHHQANLAVLMAHAWSLSEEVAGGVGFCAAPGEAPAHLREMAHRLHTAWVATWVAEEALAGRDCGVRPVAALGEDMTATVARASRQWQALRGAVPREAAQGAAAVS